MKRLLTVGFLFPMLLLGIFPGWAQENDVPGIVTDANGPLPGVSVFVKGTNIGTTTDTEGKYLLHHVETGDTIEYTFIGYRTQDIVYAGQREINVRMAEDAENIDEVVVIGYGTALKRELTGAITSVRSDEITLTPTPNAMEALQGKVAGMDIVRSSGRAGSDVNITLRGNRSINGSNEPLFLIDGMIGNYNDLNPNDIQSMEILKDASSTAIYGSAGANGVVLITTRKGRAGKPRVNYDMYAGVNGMAKYPHGRTGENYIELRRQAAITQGSWHSPEDDINIFSTAEWDAIQNNQWVDWVDLALRTGSEQNYSLSVTSGGENTQAYFSLNYNKEKGILENDDAKKYAFRANIDQNIFKWLKAGVNSQFTYTDVNQRKASVFTQSLSASPFGIPFTEEGGINVFPIVGSPSTISPLADEVPNSAVNNTLNTRFQGNAYLDILPLPGLSIRSVVGVVTNSSRQGIYNGISSLQGNSDGNSSASVENRRNYDYRWENIVNYNFTVAEDHNFALTGVTSWTKNQYEQSKASGQDISWSKYLFHNLGAAQTGVKIASDYIRTQGMSYVARLNYNYRGKYLFTFSNRWDGTSKFAPGHKWDSFPAFAVAWRASDENFMSAVPEISDLKLRIGYGVTGNSGIGAYETQTRLTAGTNLGFQNTSAPYYLFAAQLANKGLGWEKSYNTNIGLDLGLLNQRITLTFDWYNTHTKDILYNRELPGAIGGAYGAAFQMWQNICETRNRGVEIMINSQNFLKPNFTWNTTLTFTRNKEKITRLANNNDVIKGSNVLSVGHPINSYYNYKVLGIWQNWEAEQAALYDKEPGDIKIYDRDKSKGEYVYSPEDKMVLGSKTPKWILGLQNNFTVYDFDVSFFMMFRWGQIIDNKILGWYNPNGTGNGPAKLNYWTPENPSNELPRPGKGSFTDANYFGAEGLRFVNGSFFKVRNITVGYTVPVKYTEQIRLQRVRVYFTAVNPIIVAKSKTLKGYDPEAGGDDTFPLTRQFVFGINLSF